MNQPSSWKPGEMTLDRAGSSTLVAQISRHIEIAIAQGALPPGGRLPSWRDLAAQLGVARGTVKAAYEWLGDRGLLTTAGSAGTHVADMLPPVAMPRVLTAGTLEPPKIQPRSDRELTFHMGVPSKDAFPATLWARVHRQAVQAVALKTGYSDSRGLPELRSALASHVAIARGVECSPDQIIVTNGYRGGLAIALLATDAAGRRAWVEDPGYPPTRWALEASGITPLAVPVDDEGLQVEQGRASAPDVALAIVTPGQQAPTGTTLSPRRRLDLLSWAASADAWIVEDDYLAELHLGGRSSNALASGHGADRVIHIGTFSKTIAPMVGLGFLVAPMLLAPRLIEVATLLSAPPNAAVQRALVHFLRDGHYLRHLRRMRHLYAGRRRLLLERLKAHGINTARPAGLSVMITLPDGFDDEALSLQAAAAGLGPGALSPWFADPSRSLSGLNLGIANVGERSLDEDCGKLAELIRDGAAS